MSKSKSILTAALTIGVASVAAHASTFTLTPVVSFVYTDATLNTFEAANATMTGGNTLVAPIAGFPVYEIDYYATISNTAASEGFDALAFDAVTTSGLGIASPYSPDTDSYVFGTGKNAHTVAVWATSNGDKGISPTDLQDIVASMGSGPFTTGATGAAQPLNFIGQMGAGGTVPPAGYTGSVPLQTVPGLGQFVGSIFLTWNGTTPGQTLQIGDAAGHVGAVQYQTLATDTGIVNPAQFAADTDTVTFGVPEPASLGILALGGVALMARRRKA